MLQFRVSFNKVPGGLIGVRVHLMRDGRTITRIEHATVPVGGVAAELAHIRRAMWSARVAEDELA